MLKIATISISGTKVYIRTKIQSTFQFKVLIIALIIEKKTAAPSPLLILSKVHLVHPWYYWLPQKKAARHLLPVISLSSPTD